MKQSLVSMVVLGAVLAAAADVRGEDVYEAYARWWNQNVHGNTKRDVKRDDNGKRLGQVFKVPTNPSSLSAAEAEAQGAVQDPTFVLGVEIGGHARAYPTHAMGFELLNDTLGDVPIAASVIELQHLAIDLAAIHDRRLTDRSPPIAIPIRVGRYRGLYPGRRGLWKIETGMRAITGASQ